MTTAAVVLAAGAGSRFTTPGHKLLADAGGTPVVVRAVAGALAAGLDEVLVVTGAVDLAAVLPRGVRVVHNPSWVEGQASSLQAAVQAASAHDAIVVGLGDQPSLAETSWRRVAAAVATPIAIATYEGRRGHPVRLASVTWPELPAEGDQGARAVMAVRPEWVTEVACPGPYPADIDTVEDLRRWS